MWWQSVQLGCLITSSKYIDISWYLIHKPKCSLMFICVNLSIYKVVSQLVNAKLVNITPISLGFMVDIPWYNIPILFHGGYKPINITGGSTTLIGDSTLVKYCGCLRNPRNHRKDVWNPINSGMFTTYQLVQDFATIHSMKRNHWLSPMRILWLWSAPGPETRLCWHRQARCARFRTPNWGWKWDCDLLGFTGVFVAFDWFPPWLTD